jgi:hypothetical protein
MMKRLLLSLLCMALMVTGTAAAQPNVPRPLVILKQLDPWRMVIGSDAPTFVLYEDGTIIYRSVERGGELGFATVKVDDVETFMVETLKLTDTFFLLQDSYDHLLMTDQPSTTMTVYDYEGMKASSKSVYVYGDLHSHQQARDLTPAAFLNPFDAITAFDSETAKAWTPEHFEVMVWEYQTSDAVVWLSDFPGFDDPLTVQRDSVTSLYVPFKDYDRFLKLVKDQNAVKIDGKTYAFDVRIPLPHEYRSLKAG